MNLRIEGIITLRSSLAHGAFDAAGINIQPFRREGILQRDWDGRPSIDPYASEVQNPDQRELLRKIAQRLLRIIWQSRSDVQWSYAQLAERVAIAVRMRTDLPSVMAEVARKMGCGESLKYYNDDAEFFTNILSAADNNRLIYLLRDQGERMLIVARMQASSMARMEGRMEQEEEQIFLFEAPTEKREDAPAFMHSGSPHIAALPIYSGNALRNGVVRRGAARFLLEKFGWRVPLSHFRALFVGGALIKTGDKGLNIVQRRQFLELMPLYALVGGPFNRSDMVEGSVKAGKGYPLVREALPVLPPRLHDEARMMSMNNIMGVEHNSKREDAALSASQFLAGNVVGKGGNDKNVGMIFESEVMLAGTRLFSAWNFHATTEQQLGAWVSAWVCWADRGSLLGGKSQMGLGRADVSFQMQGLPFLAVTDGEIALSDDAQNALDCYQAHLDARREAIAVLLEATSADSDEATPSVAVNPDELQSEFEQAEED
jgi:hypothetical protein